jgi:hypothetical protein
MKLKDALKDASFAENSTFGMFWIYTLKFAAPLLTLLVFVYSVYTNL